MTRQWLLCDFHTPADLFSWNTLLLHQKESEPAKEAIHKNQKISLYLFREEGIPPQPR